MQQKIALPAPTSLDASGVGDLHMKGEVDQNSADLRAIVADLNRDHADDGSVAALFPNANGRKW